MKQKSLIVRQGFSGEKYGIYSRVGVERFELPISCSQSRRGNRTTLYPEFIKTVGKTKNTEPKNRPNTAIKSPGEPKINVNNASKSELMRLPGIGDKLSDKIIAYRSVHGGFRTIDDLQSVKGIGV